MLSAGDTAINMDTTSGVNEQTRTLESILQRLIYKDTFRLPKTYDGTESIKEHLSKVEDYFRACGITNEETKIAILFNSLSDDSRWELCGLLEFSSHKDDYRWIKDKLTKLFESKETKITPLIKLFACKQGPRQRTREFLAEIRRQGYLLMKDMDPEAREKYMIHAFINGLINKDVREALVHMEIESLDEAFDIVKKETPSNIYDEANIRAVYHDTTEVKEIEKLHNQMSIIQKQLTYIVKILQNNTRVAKPTYAEVTQRQKNELRPQPILKEPQRVIRGTNPQQRHCWSCGQPNHIARYCNAAYNRVSERDEQWRRRNIRANQMPTERRVRKMRTEEDLCEEWDDESATEAAMTNTDSDDGIYRENSGKEDVVHAMTIHNKSDQIMMPRDVRIAREHIRRQMKSTKRNTKQHLYYPSDIIELSEYIEGKRREKPTMGGETVISVCNQEKAANKPVVKGMCNNREVKIFCDSGAEINVADLAMVEELKKQDSSITIRQSSKVIRCANNSRMNVLGWVRLNVKIGESYRNCKVWVVPKLFPRLILGIRTMKAIGISIDLVNDCIRVHNRVIPFISKTRPESIVSEN